MMFKSVVLATLAASAAATSFIPNGDIPADSKVGNRLMSKARALEQQGDNTWMANYNIKYLGCSSLVQVRAEGGGGEDESLLYTQNLVKFALCPASESCSSCSTGSAQYVVPLNEFVDAYTEMKMNEQEQACENIRENCYCDNANDDEACENQCYTNYNMDYCIQYEGDEEFEIQRYLECDELEGGDNNNNNGGNYQYGNNNNGVDMYRQYWVGPTCSDGESINLSVFLDAGCTTKANSGVYEAFNYGNSLPFEKKSLVKKNACVECKQVEEDENNNNNNNQNNNNNNNYNYQENYEIAEICEQSYEMSAKCEENLDAGNYFYPDTTGCNYINKVLPKLSKASSSLSRSGVSGSGDGSTAATAFAVLFFLSTCILGAYAFFLYRKIHRAKVNLSQSEGMTMA